MTLGRYEHVILDPGIGFGKLPEHNLALLRSLDRIVALGFPTLIGTSRKGFLGRLIGLIVILWGLGALVLAIHQRLRPQLTATV